MGEEDTYQNICGKNNMMFEVALKYSRKGEISEVINKIKLTMVW